MECYFPGRVLVGPGPESEDPRYLVQEIIERFPGDFELDFMIGDILEGNGVELPAGRLKRLLPFVGRVPEGTEEDFSARISSLKRTGAATPDYLVYPNAPITINDKAITSVIHSLNGTPKSPQCGGNCRVGVIDSGIDPNLAGQAQIHQRQFDALNPASGGTVLSDTLGHGTLIARIIREVAPGSEIISIKAFDRNGTISSVIAALYLAQAAGPCDVINLSLSMSCAPIPCMVCRTPTPAAATIPQLSYFFEIFLQNAPDTILVAAGGNNMTHLALPAAFDRVIAVGSFDYAKKRAISQYHQVPVDRFVLAPGGSNSSQNAYASRQIGVSRIEYLNGTSFAAAFVSGFAARVVCNAKSASCGTGLIGHPNATYGTGILASVLGELAAKADNRWLGFDPLKHGLGAILF